jgi:cytoskeletal protein CcmA (bactofilin family)
MRITIDGNNTINGNITIDRVVNGNPVAINMQGDDQISVNITIRLDQEAQIAEMMINGRLTMNGTLDPMHINGNGIMSGGPNSVLTLSESSLNVDIDENNPLSVVIIRNTDNVISKNVFVQELRIENDSDFNVSGQVSVNNRLVIEGNPSIDYSNIRIKQEGAININGVPEFTLAQIDVKKFNPTLDCSILFDNSSRMGSVILSLKIFDNIPDELKDEFYTKDEQNSIELYKENNFHYLKGISKSIKYQNTDGTKQKLPEGILKKVFSYLMINDIDTGNELSGITPLFSDIPDDNYIEEASLLGNDEITLETTTL